MEEKYLLIIDTEEYAGNFERQLCGYVTGQADYDTQGKEEADIFLNEVDADIANWFEENIVSITDVNGNDQFVKLSPTPGWFNDGVGNHYKNGCDPLLVVKKYNKIQKKYKEKYPNSSSCELVTSIDEIVKYPAYMSIEIMFYKKPSNIIIDLVAERARKFCEDSRFDFRPEKITAIRLVKRIIKDEEVRRDT
jgi:hypothetical protein